MSFEKSYCSLSSTDRPIELIHPYPKPLSTAAWCSKGFSTTRWCGSHTLGSGAHTKVVDKALGGPCASAPGAINNFPKCVPKMKFC